MYTNVTGYGGEFLDVVEREFRDCANVSIASGYASYGILDRFNEGFQRVASKGGEAKLLLGMAFYEGLSANKLSLLKEISEKLEGYGNSSGVYVSYSGKYHGKVYLFDKGKQKNVYIGSSNFSYSGLTQNIECTTLIKDDATKDKAKHFLDFLFHNDNAVSILKADITVQGTTQYREKLALSSLDDLEKYDDQRIDKTTLPVFEICLKRIVDKEKSNLNVYFGKGRWNRATGKVILRPWYEVELITTREVNSNPLYPKGDFLAYTDDGYIMPMRTSGDYHKNIRSRGSLSILGQWIKGKLQKTKALIPLTPVTLDTLDAYGNDTIRFYKMDEGKYYMIF